MSGGSAYLWMAARARNALRRVVVFGIVGGVVFIGALIAFVVVPRNASRKALAVASRIEARTDSMPAVAARDRYLADIGRADSVMNATRLALTPVPTPVIDTFPPAVRAQRDSLSGELATLNRLIDRAENAPLPTSYRALAASPTVAADPRVRVLLDSLAYIERERNAFGAVGGVDPVYLSLTSRATAIGREIKGIADIKRGEVRGKLALIRPTSAPVPKPVITVDTTKLLAQRDVAQQNYAAAVKQLSLVAQKNSRIDRESAHARDLANVGAPPWAMLAAAVVLALAVGFAASFGTELKRPHIADPREAEQISGARVLTVIKPPEVVVERSRRQVDVEAPPLIDVVSESYRTLYLHIASVEASVPIVTITGDDPGIVATVAANLAASAAYEARSTLLVDVDPTTTSVASVLRIQPDPGLSGIITGSATWPEAIVPTTIGRDRPLDVIPSGTRRSGLPDANVVEEVRKELARMQRRYDFIIIAAPTSYVQRSASSIIPAPDVIFCARIAHTTVSGLKTAVDSLRGADMRIHGLVLWDAEMPQLETREEILGATRQSGAYQAELVAAQ
ncbi:MAG: AAA family ATPase [Gemmatimonadales bacterium]